MYFTYIQRRRKYLKNHSQSQSQWPCALYHRYPCVSESPSLPRRHDKGEMHPLQRVEGLCLISLPSAVFSRRRWVGRPCLNFRSSQSLRVEVRCGSRGGGPCLGFVSRPVFGVNWAGVPGYVSSQDQPSEGRWVPGIVEWAPPVLLLWISAPREVGPGRRGSGPFLCFFSCPASRGKRAL